MRRRRLLRGDCGRDVTGQARLGPAPVAFPIHLAGELLGPPPTGIVPLRFGHPGPRPPNLRGGAGDRPSWIQAGPAEHLGPPGGHAQIEPPKPLVQSQLERNVEGEVEVGVALGGGLVVEARQSPVERASPAVQEREADQPAALAAEDDPAVRIEVPGLGASCSVISRGVRA